MAAGRVKYAHLISCMAFEIEIEEEDLCRVVGLGADIDDGSNEGIRSWKQNKIKILDIKLRQSI